MGLQGAGLRQRGIDDAREGLALGRRHGQAHQPAAPPESQAFGRVIDATLSETGALEAHFMERSAGQAAVPERSLRGSSSEAEYRAALEHWLAAGGASVELKRLSTTGDSLAGTFGLDLEFSAPMFARTLGGQMITFRPSLVSPRAPPPLPDSARTQPIVLPAECFAESVAVRLPDGFAPDDLPPVVDKTTDFGSLHAEWRVEGQTLRFMRRQRVALVHLPAERYADVRAFYALAARVRNMAVVLVRK